MLLIIIIIEKSGEQLAHRLAGWYGKEPAVTYWDRMHFVVVRVLFDSLRYVSIKPKKTIKQSNVQRANLN